MIEEHRVFEEPENIDQQIWRYFDFTKFVDLLTTSSLYFCRADQFEDFFEGSVTRETVRLRGYFSSGITKQDWNEIGTEKKKNIAINCWHMNNHESAAMWKLYLQSNEGIAIQTTFKNLKDCIDESELKIHLGIVKYIDFDREVIPWNNGLLPFLHKRKSFEHERELRALIWSQESDNRDKIDLSSGGISVQIDLLKLIERVYVSPESKDWFTKLVNRVIDKLGFEIIVTNSRLNGKPIY